MADASCCLCLELEPAEHVGIRRGSCGNGNGNFIVHGFGPEAFHMNGRRCERNAAFAKAAGAGQPVKEDIGVSMKGDNVDCSINGTVVGGYDKATLVSTGKLKSTDGIYVSASRTTPTPSSAV